jgi:hypothetical protein
MNSQTIFIRDVGSNHGEIAAQFSVHWESFFYIKLNKNKGLICVGNEDYVCDFPAKTRNFFPLKNRQITVCQSVISLRFHWFSWGLRYEKGAHLYAHPYRPSSRLMNSQTIFSRDAGSNHGEISAQFFVHWESFVHIKLNKNNGLICVGNEDYVCDFPAKTRIFFPLKNRQITFCQSVISLRFHWFQVLYVCCRSGEGRAPNRADHQRHNHQHSTGRWGEGCPKPIKGGGLDWRA